MPGRVSSVIAHYQYETNPQDENDWNNQHNWMATNLKKFDEIFRQRLQDFDPADWEESEFDDII